jgi:hypothetical protein
VPRTGARSQLSPVKVRKELGRARRPAFQRRGRRILALDLPQGPRRPLTPPARGGRLEYPPVTRWLSKLTMIQLLTPQQRAVLCPLL